MRCDRVRAATALAARDQARRPLLLVLLVLVPAYAVTRSLAITQATPRTIGLPGGVTLMTTMRDIHGAVMAGNAVAWIAALCGVFVMQSAFEGDRRLVLAGFRPSEIVLPRLLILASSVLLVAGVSLAVTAIAFDPARWAPFAAGTLLIGSTYGSLGAAAGSVLDRLAATYLMLFLALTDIGIAQNPMFGEGVPPGWAVLLPGYGAARTMIDGALAADFHGWGPLVLAVIWVAALATLVSALLARSLRVRR